jgi:hypothetical protein
MRRRLRELLDRLRDWWNGPPGRHAYYFPGPVAPASRAGDQDDEPDWLRAMHPRLYAPDEDYWRERWTDFCIWAARMAADATAYRRQWGLPDAPLSTRPDLISLPSLSAVA